jgi:hypothetical protein
MGLKDYVSIPLNFERRPEVRMLARRLGNGEGNDPHPHFMSGASQCVALALGIWMEFAIAGTRWRPLTMPMVDGHAGAASEHPWDREEVTFLIEGAAGWDGKPGALIQSALDAGILAVEYHGDVAGLTICGVFGFGDLNAHLLPGYESMQQKGAKASQESRRRKDDVAGAKQQRRILEAREERLPIFESQAATTAEVDAALALISGVDRACGHAARLAGEFTQTLVEAAVEVTRDFQPREIEEAMNCLIRGRDNPAIVKRTDFVLTHFAEYVTFRRAPSCDKSET